MSSCACGGAIVGRDTLCASCGALRELGLAAGATMEDVKAAYKTLVKVWHPDRFPGDPKLARAAELKLKAINAAYSYLTAKGYVGGPGSGGARATSSAGKGFDGGAGGWGARATEAASGASQAGMGQAGMGGAAGRAGVGMAGNERRRGRGFGRRMLVRLSILGVVVGIAALAFELVDSSLANDTRVGRYYVDLKTQVSSEFGAAWRRTWGELTERAKGVVGGGARSAPAAAAVASEQAVTTAEPEAKAQAGGGAGAKQAEGQVRLLPYVTLGLTREEVESAQGEPTSATDDRLMYGASELDLKDDKVVGWKIDRRSPLRVKLWPEGPVDTSLRRFTVGSTKDEVLVVQGTPSSFSQDRFEYGGAVVYFRDGRVVAWKEGAGPVRLRAE